MAKKKVAKLVDLTPREMADSASTALLEASHAAAKRSFTAPSIRAQVALLTAATDAYRAVIGSG